MAVWTTIPDSDIDPDSPFTTGLATAYRENVIAAFEGASGAPQMHPSSALSDTITTDGSQSIGTVASWTPPQGLYNMVGLGTLGAANLQLFISAAWRVGLTSISGMAFFDGTNMRLYNSTGSAKTTYWQRFDG